MDSDSLFRPLQPSKALLWLIAILLMLGIMMFAVWMWYELRLEVLETQIDSLQ